MSFHERTAALLENQRPCFLVGVRLSVGTDGKVEFEEGSGYSLEGTVTSGDIAEAIARMWIALARVSEKLSDEFGVDVRKWNSMVQSIVHDLGNPDGEQGNSESGALS